MFFLNLKKTSNTHSRTLPETAFYSLQVCGTSILGMCFTTIL